MRSMFLALAVTMAATAAFAEDVTVLNMAYLPPKGGHEIDVGYANSDTGMDLKVTTNLIASQKIKSSGLGVDYSYGYTDRVTFAARLTQSLSNTMTTSNGPAGSPPNVTTESKSGGTYDPDFGVNWRIKTAEQSGFHLDAKLVYSPKLMSAVDGSSTKDGTVARGGDEIVVSGAMTWVDWDSEYGGVLTKTFAGNTTKEGTGGDVTGSGGGSLSLKGRYLYRMNKIFLGADYSFLQKESSDTTYEDGSKLTLDSTSATEIALRAKYLVTPTSGVSFAWHRADISSFSGKVGGTKISVTSAAASGFDLSYALAF